MISCEHCGSVSVGKKVDPDTELPEGWLRAALPAREAPTARAGKKVTIQAREEVVCSEACRDGLLAVEATQDRMMRKQED